jgi:hypothetical protein
MRYFNLAALALILLFERELFAQHRLSKDYPFLYEVVLACDVRYDAIQKMYYYDYALTNDRANKGNIWIFEIDILRHHDSVKYDTLGLKFANNFEKIQFERYYPPAADIVESVGFPSLANKHWDVNIFHGSVASFGVDTLLPKPGSTVTGFAMMSKAPPGTRVFAAYPDFDVYKFYPDIEQDTTAGVDSIYRYVDSIKEAVNYHGWTIGPTAPPADFSATSWIDTLISYKHQCVSQGWLTDNKTCKRDCDDIMSQKDWRKNGDFEQYAKWNPDNSWNFDTDWNNGIVEVLDGRLNKAQAELSKKDSVDARKDLEIFVIEVEMLSIVDKKIEAGNQNPIMTSEAYALLKYNTEYLIDRLP